MLFQFSSLFSSPILRFLQTITLSEHVKKNKNKISFSHQNLSEMEAENETRRKRKVDESKFEPKKNNFLLLNVFKSGFTCNIIDFMP